MEKPILQVALDLLSISDAIVIAKECVEAGVDWLEVGTPLIKNHGVAAISEIKKNFPNKVVVADMKTMDTGEIEVEIAAKNGADIVTVLGCADDMTIIRAVEAAHSHGIQLMVDLISVDDEVKRAKEVEELGADIILLHTAIDVQKSKLTNIAKESLKKIEEIKKSCNCKLAVAGGITKETAKQLVDAGADILIVGRALTKAKDVKKATLELLNAMGRKIELAKKKIEKKRSLEEIVREFAKIPTPFISDAMRRHGAMRGLKPMLAGIRIAGKAFTVRTQPGDWGKVVKAIDLAEPGDVIVVDAQGSEEIAIWGGLASLTAKRKGIAGIVIDGAIRDIDDIKTLKFPVWAKAIVPNAGDPHGHGMLNIPINCGGVVVKPGDIIVADEIGVVVVPKEKANEILEKSLEVAEKERRYREEILKGKSLAKIFGL